MKHARTSVLRERLAKAAAYLERLDVERISHGDLNLGKSVEERIIWRELLDLELQECDEEIERLSEVAHNLIPAVGTVKHACGKTQQHLRPVTPSPWWRLNRFFR